MESISLKYIVLLLAALFLISCESDMNTPKDYDGVQASWDIFIENGNQMNTEGCMAIFFDDAILIPPQLLELDGKKAIIEFYEKLFSLHRSATFEHVTQSINFSKEQAIEVANFSIQWVSHEGDSSLFNARGMIHWEKDQFGDWKIKKMLFNNPPSQPEE